MNSIGLRREPPPAPPRPYITNAVFMRPTPHYASPVPTPAPQAVVEPAPQAVVDPAPQAVVEPEPQAVEPEPVTVAAEPAPPSFLIAARLRDGDQGGPAESPFTRLMPKIAMRESPAPDDEDAPLELNRTLAIAGSLILAVGLIGAWAGSQAGQDAQDANPTNAVTMRVPKAKAAQAAAEPVEADVPLLASAPPPPLVRAPVVRRTAPAIAAAPDEPRPERSVAEQNQFARDSIAQATQELPVVTDSPASATVTAASMPLSDATVARTIQRIGYSCGKVASTSAGDGAGVFTVTCTSGQSFQARPVRGRYHFRRLGR